MDDESLNFGSDAAGATPGSNSILAQPPLQPEPVVGEEGSSAQGGQATECMLNGIVCHKILLTKPSCRCLHG